MNTLMSTPNSTLPEPPQETRLEEIQARLKKLERRDWWLWAIAIVVMLSADSGRGVAEFSRTDENGRSDFSIQSE